MHLIAANSSILPIDHLGGDLVIRHLSSDPFEEHINFDEQLYDTSRLSNSQLAGILKYQVWPGLIIRDFSSFRSDVDILFSNDDSPVGTHASGDGNIFIQQYIFHGDILISVEKYAGIIIDRINNYVNSYSWRKSGVVCRRQEVSKSFLYYLFSTHIIGLTDKILYRFINDDAYLLYIMSLVENALDFTSTLNNRLNQRFYKFEKFPYSKSKLSHIGRLFNSLCGNNSVSGKIHIPKFVLFP